MINLLYKFLIIKNIIIELLFYLSFKYISKFLFPFFINIGKSYILL